MSNLREQGRGSLLAVPAVFVLGALTLSVVTVLADELFFGFIPEAVLFRGDADSARSMLTSIASSTITLTGLVFSVTMLVLQLTAAQYSPRAVGALLTDRNSKYTLGVFVGTFVYSLAVLRTIATEGAEFDRSLSVAVAVLLALVTIGFFIHYVNHVARQIRPSSILGRVGHETEAAIDAHFPEIDDEEHGGMPPDARARRIAARTPPVPDPLPLGDPDHVVTAPKAGVVRTIDASGLVARSVDDDLRIEVVPRVGEFVPGGAPLLRCWGALDADEGDDGLDDLAGHVTLGGERNMAEDPLYGFRQLVDVAERALSPGTNDPTTAVQAIDQIHHALRRTVDRRFPSGVHTDDEGRGRVVVPEPSWEEILDLAVDEIAHYGEDSLQVCKRLRAMLHDLETVAPPHRAEAITGKIRVLERQMA